MSEESTKATIEKRTQEIAAGLPLTTAIGYTPEEAELSHAITVEGASALRAIEQRHADKAAEGAKLLSDYSKDEVSEPQGFRYGHAARMLAVKFMKGDSHVRRKY